MSIRTGTPGPHPQPTSYGRNDAGQFSTISFEDVDPNKINLMAATYDAQGYNYTVDHSFGKSKLTVQISYNYQQQGNEVPLDLWEYVGRSTPKDILQAVTNTGITATLTQKNIELLRKCQNDNFSDTADKKTLVASDFTDGNPANAMKLYALMKSNVTDYPIIAPILRHTQTVSFVYPITLSQLNVGKIISTSTMFALEPTLPGWAANGLPTIAPPTFTDGKRFAFGWFKDSPTIQQIAFRKQTITQEFQYGLWALEMYGNLL